MNSYPNQLVNEASKRFNNLNEKLSDNDFNKARRLYNNIIIEASYALDLLSFSWTKTQINNVQNIPGVIDFRKIN